MAIIKGKQLTDSLSVTNVTGSNVSASGLIIGNSGSFQHLQADGDLKVSQYIKHIGNETTFINFTSNRIRFKAGDVGFADMEKDASTPYPFTINQGGNRINFRVMDRNTDLVLKTDSEAFNVGLYHAGNKKLETTSAGIDVSNINVTASGHITASGNISSSANITGNILNVNTRVKAIGSSLEFAGNTLDFVDGSSAGRLFKGTAGGSFEAYYNGQKKIETTAGGILIGSGSIPGNITASGDIVLDEDQRVYFEADKGTYIESHASDTFRVVVNNRQMFLLDEDTGNRAIFGNGTKVFIGANNNRIPTASLHIGGDIWASGSNGHITASGNITANNFSGIFNGALSSSAQIASNISGSFTPASASFSTRITTEEGNVDTLQGRTLTAGDGLTGGGTLASDRTFAVGQGTGVTVNANDVAIGQDVATTANVTFATITTTGNIESQGDVIAQNYIVSSSVTHMTSSFRSGSTISGDTPSDDTHQFTGSLFISGSTPNDITTTNSIFVGNHISASGNITGSQIEASGDVIAFGSSDRRLKDNITPIENPLDKMDKIGGYTFIWNNKQSTYKGKDIGVVAQEIEEILPELVTTRGTGYKAVKYEKIVPLLIESIKELQKKVQNIEENCDCLNK